jgi:hypothetical protein
VSIVRGMGWPAVLLVTMLDGPSPAGQHAPSGAAPDIAAPPAPAACAAGAAYLSCTGGCEPGKLIFLPCMAVGATGMADCRQREVAACLRACISRHCP